MIGLVTWILAASVAVVGARFLPWLRRHWLVESFAALVAAVVAGMYATGADFGGWKEIDIRAIVFTFVCASASIAILRLVLPRRSFAR